MKKLFSPLIRELWQACSLTAYVQVWKARNKKLYEEKDTNKGKILYVCRAAVRKAYERSKNGMHNTISDLQILHNFELPSRAAKPTQVVECYWSLPPVGFVKVNTDGAARGNPGPAGWGVIYRSNNGEILGTSYGGLGIETNFFAETIAIFEGVKIAVAQGWQNIWVEADSESAMRAFQTNDVHWKLSAQWKELKNQATNLILTINRREANFAADACSKKGSYMLKGERAWWSGKPPFNLAIEDPDSVYYRFV